MSANAAGMDICAAVSEPLLLKTKAVALVPTGFAMALPDGYEAQIRPRSGLAVKHGLSLINSPGTIDSDYRGEIKIAMINLGPEDYLIRRGERIAQMIIQRVWRAEVALVDHLEPTERNTGGFGHTGR
jgi:dUTP pyrophosphatase